MVHPAAWFGGAPCAPSAPSAPPRRPAGGGAWALASACAGLGLIAMLAGCGQDEAPAAAAGGAVVVHLWERPGVMPARIEASHVRQLDPQLNRIALEGVFMRLPKADGVVYLSSPLADYAQDQATALRLYGPPGADGPVRFNGIWRGKLFVGRAADAISLQHTHAMRFNDVEMVCEGVCQWTASAEVLENRLPFGRTERRMDVPAVVAALAALPQPLDLPE